MRRSKSNTTSILIFLAVIIIAVIVLSYKNTSNTPKTCVYGEGLIYNNDDFGAVLGIGGYKCGSCEPDGRNYVDVDGYCKQCDRNKYYDGTKCVTCSKGQYLDPHNNKCICDEYAGYYMMNGQCSKCPDNQAFFNNACNTCIGGDIISGSCVCPIGYVYYAGSCVPCSGTILGNTCLCPTGMALTNIGCKVMP